MSNNKRFAFIVAALVVIAAAGFAISRLFGGVSYAEGYLYEEENRMIYAKVTPGEEQGQVKVDVTDTYVEEEDSVPVLKTASSVYTGSAEDGKLALTSAQQPGKPVAATVTADELVFLGPLQEGGQALPKLAASQDAAYQKQLAAMTARINELAEGKKKELAEKRAKEAARVEFAKKVEKTDRLVADLVENAQYLTDLQFADEASLYQEQVAELQGLLEEVRLYAGQPGLQQAEYAVMKEHVSAMKVLVDGIKATDTSVKGKKQRMTDIMSVLETDLADVKATWEEIRNKGVPKPDERQKALDKALSTASEAIAQAKQRMAAIDKQQSSAGQKAAQMYSEANALLGKSEPK
ncbi:hypothetical protein ACFSO0_08290 [Brevibacillus sp. GCM10020057]|uniref:hypothetical protein n=1 Tax=Brevibacillus sp. GCM10020057 TaxID=3317327 RepID=UPI003632BE64